MRRQLSATVTALTCAVAAVTGCSALSSSGSNGAAVVPAVHRHLTSTAKATGRPTQRPTVPATRAAARPPDLKALLTRAELTTQAAGTALFDEQLSARLTTSGEPPVGLAGARTFWTKAGEVDFSTSRYHSYYYESTENPTDVGLSVSVAHGAPDRASWAKLVIGTRTWRYLDPAEEYERDRTGPGGTPSDIVDVTSHINGRVLALGRAHLPGSQSTFLAYETTVDYRQVLLDGGEKLSRKESAALQGSHATEIVWVDSAGRIAQFQLRLGSLELSGLGYSLEDQRAFTYIYDTTTLRNWGAPFYEHVPSHQVAILSPTKSD